MPLACVLDALPADRLAGRPCLAGGIMLPYDGSTRAGPGGGR